MVENRKPLPKIGVDMMYYAPVVSDNDEGTVYGAAKRLPGLNSIGYDPGTQSATYDADDGTYDSYSADGASKAAIRVADLLSEDRAFLLGLSQDASGVIEEGTNDSPPEVAIGWRSQKSDGTYRFVWLLKGKFAKGAEKYATKSADGVTYSDQELVFTTLNRCDGKKRRQVDSDDPKLPGGMTLTMLSSAEDGWFSDPDYLPGGGTSEPDPEPEPSLQPEPIDNLVAQAGEDSGTVVLGFSAPEGALVVTAQASTDGEVWDAAQLEEEILADSVSAVVTGLDSGKELLFRLVVDGGRRAGVSNVVKVMVA